MWWLALAVIVVIVVYFVYSRNTAKVRLSKEQLELTKDLVEKKIEQIREEKKEIIDQAAKEGKTIPLAPLLESLEKSKKEHKGNEEYIAEIDRRINELKEKYRTNIPVDEAYKLVTDYEDKHGPV